MNLDSPPTPEQTKVHYPQPAHNLTCPLKEQPFHQDTVDTVALFKDQKPPGEKSKSFPGWLTNIQTNKNQRNFNRENYMTLPVKHNDTSILECEDKETNVIQKTRSEKIFKLTLYCQTFAK